MDTLKELINISFGHAAADLAEVMDIFIKLHSPDVELIRAGKILEQMKKAITGFDKTTIVEQHYYGEIKGVAVLVFPEGSDRKLLTYLKDSKSTPEAQESILDLEKEIIMELGNILLGACLGNLFKILHSQTTYLPPWTNSGGIFENVFLSETIKESDTAITMQTKFIFENQDISGHLFIINSNSSMQKIKKALIDYWKEYNVL